MERSEFEGIDLHLSALPNWIYVHALGESSVSNFRDRLGKYTVIGVFVVLVESGKRDAPWVIFHSCVNVEKSIPGICQKHKNERCETNSPK